MIPLIRDRSAGAVHENFVDAKKIVFETELLLERKQSLVDGKKQKFSSKRWGAAKPQLLTETKGKCAYCEAPTHEVAFGDVEHYRPKSVYWWLAYSYDNYLASCQLCNQKFKKAKFPVSGTRLKGPTVRKNSRKETLEAKAGTLGPDPLDAQAATAFAGLHQAERPLLLNPYFDKPEDFFKWSADDVLQEVVVIPKNAAAQAFVAAAEDGLGLNRKQLRTSRYRTFSTYRALRAALESGELNAGTEALIQAEVTKMGTPEFPYSGMIRFYEGRALSSL